MDAYQAVYLEEKEAMSDPEYLKDLLNREIREIRKSAWQSLRYDYRRGRQIERDDYDFQMAFLPLVETVTEVLEVEPGGLGVVNQYAYAVAERNGGVLDVISYRYFYSSGTRIDPPDSELWVEWHGLPHTREDATWPCFCSFCEKVKEKYGQK